MDTFIVKKDSWHYRWIAWNWATFKSGKRHNPYESFWQYAEGHPNTTIVDYYERYSEGRPYNFCMYWRAALVWPTVRLAFSVGSLSLLIAAITANVIATAQISGVLIAALSFFLFLGFVGYGFSILWNKWRGSRDEAIDDDQPGLLASAYHAYKEKYCPGVTYEKKGA